MKKSQKIIQILIAILLTASLLAPAAIAVPQPAAEPRIQPYLAELVTGTNIGGRSVSRTRQRPVPGVLRIL